MKQLFLKWCVANVVVATVIGLALWLNWSSSESLSTIGKGIVLMVTVVFLRATLKAGWICWCIDGQTERLATAVRFSSPEVVSDAERRLKKLRHSSEHIAFAANECPFWGLLGAVLGMYYLSKGNLAGLDASHLQAVVGTLMSGVGIAFLPTIAGVFFRNVLTWEHHQITHRIIHALEDM